MVLLLHNISYENLLAILLLLILTACGVKTIYHSNTTSRIYDELNSLSEQYNIEYTDTADWDKIYFRKGQYQYYQYNELKGRKVVTTITPLDSTYRVTFKYAE